MDKFNESDRRKIILSYFNENPSWSINQIFLAVKPFKIGRSTVYDVIKRFKAENTIERRTGSGRPPQKMTAAKKARFLKKAENSSLSARKLGDKFKISRS